MAHEYVETNGVRLHVVQEGPEDGPLVILLHGFPEYSYGWRRQIPYLASAGYRVWVPDQRGYNLSDKPDGLASYSLDELVADVVGLIDAAGQGQAYLVGHDWGAAVAWWMAAKYPDRLSRMVVMNVPHAAVMQKHLKSSLAQLRKSWYIFFFQIPWIPEILGRVRNWSFVTWLVRRSSHPGTFTEHDFEMYRKAWAQPKAYRSMLNWYRAFVQKPLALPSSPRISVPTLLIWGAQDIALGREMAQPSIDLCDDGHLVLFEQATHWVQHDEADRVNELVDTFLRNGTAN
jgi:pimeloyl-ACP methyl ester carboxylesterase